jgi:integrative and conjugative element protein (TIGR02256 family)
VRHTVSTVLFTPQAAAAITGLAAAASDGLETGGILLGTDQGLGGQIMVRHCGGPGPAAVRRRNYFRRDLAHATALAEDAAKADGSVWIGEWHTHGIDMPEPSTRDLRTYWTLLNDPELGFARVLSVVVLADPKSGWKAPRLHAWSFTGTVLRRLPIDTAGSGASASGERDMP